MDRAYAESYREAQRTAASDNIPRGDAAPRPDFPHHAVAVECLVGWNEKHDVVRHGGGVPQEELDRVQKAAPAEYTDVFYAPAYRCIQTALAIVAAWGCKARVHEPFNTSEPDLKKVFDLIPPNGFGLVVGHAEAIEKAANNSYSLSYLGYIDFMQDGKGQIIAY